MAAQGAESAHVDLLAHRASPLPRFHLDWCLRALHLHDCLCRRSKRRFFFARTLHPRLVEYPWSKALIWSVYCCRLGKQARGFYFKRGFVQGLARASPMDEPDGRTPKITIKDSAEDLDAPEEEDNSKEAVVVKAKLDAHHIKRMSTLLRVSSLATVSGLLQRVLKRQLFQAEGRARVVSSRLLTGLLRL
jgi:hypothetical protein